MDARDAVLFLLREHKCVRVRTTPHPIYRVPNGRQLTFPSTPSDYRAWRNALRDLRVELGLSKRGRVATKGEPRKYKPGAPRTQTQTIYAQDRKAHVFDFREKVRAALSGETLKPPEESKPIKKEKPAPSPTDITPVHPGKVRILQRAQARHGAVRVWSKEEIEAANRAARAGRLNEFMRKYDAAQAPESQLNRPEGLTMAVMEITTIDSTIAELKTVIQTAHTAAAEELRRFDDLEKQKQEANDRRQSALDQANSMEETIASLELARENMVRIRPMLGMLVNQPKLRDEQPGRKRSNISHSVVIEGIEKVFERLQKPLTPKELHRELRTMPGLTEYPMPSLYNLLTLQKKKNGEAVIRSVGESRYMLRAQGQVS